MFKKAIFAVVLALLLPTTSLAQWDDHHFFERMNHDNDHWWRDFQNRQHLDQQFDDLYWRLHNDSYDNYGHHGHPSYHGGYHGSHYIPYGRNLQNQYFDVMRRSSFIQPIMGPRPKQQPSARELRARSIRIERLRAERRQIVKNRAERRLRNRQLIGPAPLLPQQRQQQEKMRTGREF